MKIAQLYIGGQWREAADGAIISSINPATGAVHAAIAAGTGSDAEAAVVAARSAFAQHGRSSMADRARWLNRMADLLTARREELARTLSIDQGKPYASEALAEVDATAFSLRNSAALLQGMNPQVPRPADPQKRAYSYWAPRGVAAVLTAYNYPIGGFGLVGAAVAAGNAAIWVPSPHTAYTAAHVVRVLAEADLPPGLVNLVTGAGAVVGQTLAGHDGVDCIGFIGSWEVGRSIASQAAGKALLLEMGGNGPVVVLADADLERAARAIPPSSFLNAGQNCFAAGRVLVDRRVHDELAQRLAAAAGTWRLGDPLAAETTMGPLNNGGIAAKVGAHVEDARRRGARVLCGGRQAPAHGSPWFYEPTVVCNVPADALLNREETFGPVLPLVPFADVEEALRLAAMSPYGLTAAVFSADLEDAFQVAESLRSGGVVINDGPHYWDLNLPFGGGAGSHSGIGRAHGRYAVEAMSDLRTVAFDIGPGPGRRA